MQKEWQYLPMQLLIRYYGYLWKCMYLVSLKKTKT